MKLILVVNDSPWGSTLALAASRIARAAIDAGHQLEAVFFKGEGVYNAVTGTAAEADAPDLARTWAEIGEKSGCALMICQASARRRLNQPVARPFSEAGLVELADRLMRTERVVTF